MIDLAVRQNDCADTGTAQYVRVIQFGRGQQLMANVRRDVTQHPVFTVVADGDRGLGAARGVNAVVANATAVFAVAIPLGKAAARCRAENFYLHVKTRTRRKRCPHERRADGRLAVGNIQRYFQAQAQINKLRFSPGSHSGAPLHASYSVGPNEKRSHQADEC